MAGYEEMQGEPLDIRSHPTNNVAPHKYWGDSNTSTPMPINTEGANRNVKSGVASGKVAPDDAKFDLQGNWKSR